VEFEGTIERPPLLRQRPASGIPTEIGASTGHPGWVGDHLAVDNR
jgi:hypothetical protein